MFDVDKKQFTENFIRAIIESIVKDGLEPNAGEARDICAAIGAMAGRVHTSSLVYAEAAVMAPKERLSPRESNLAEPATVKQLLEALNYVAVRPAKGF